MMTMMKICAMFLLSCISLPAVHSSRLPFCCDEKSETFQNGSCLSSFSKNLHLDLLLTKIHFINDLPHEDTPKLEVYSRNLSCMEDSIYHVDITKNGSNYLKYSGEDMILVWSKKEYANFCIYPFKGKFLAKTCEMGTADLPKSIGKYSNLNYLDCTTDFCLSKCCRPGEAVNLVKGNISCFPLPRTPTGSAPSFYTEVLPYLNTTKDISFLVSFPLCLFYGMGDVRIFSNGTLFIPKTFEFIPIGSYCVDYFYVGENKILSASVCSAIEELTAFELISHMAYPLAFIASCIFLAVTFVIHILIPKLRDMQGYCFMSYTAALFMSFLLLYMNRRVQNMVSDQGCLILGIFNQYFLLSAFFWLNVMCFDIWRVVRKSFKMVPLSTLKTDEVKTLALYSLYGWGCPLVVSIVTIILQFLPEEYLSDGMVRPIKVENECWFEDLKIQFAYYSGIVALLLFLNLIFIVHSAVRFQREGLAFTCCKSKKEDGELRIHNRQHLKTFWQRFCLFSLMALNWTTEILSYIPPAEMWVLTDMINALQGVFVFIIFLRSTHKRVLIGDAWKTALRKIRARRLALKTSSASGTSTPLNARFNTNEAQATIISEENT